LRKQAGYQNLATLQRGEKLQHLKSQDYSRYEAKTDTQLNQTLLDMLNQLE
jgi:hypothetical protein